METTSTNRRNIKVGGYSQVVRNAKKNQRRSEAAIRNEEHSKLTLRQKLDKAAARPGNSRLEVRRLQRRMEQSKTSKK